MDNQKLDINQYLIEAAKAYSELLNLEIVLVSSEFKNQETYKIKFFGSNFLHLTGVVTNLTADEFFDKCLLGKITFEEYYFTDRKDKTTVKKKLKNLININKFFLDEVMVQESYSRNEITCKIATSDGRCTIGFKDVRHYFVPKTILANNHLNKDKCIIVVKPIIK